MTAFCPVRRCASCTRRRPRPVRRDRGCGAESACDNNKHRNYRDFLLVSLWLFLLILCFLLGLFFHAFLPINRSVLQIDYIIYQKNLKQEMRCVTIEFYNHTRRQYLYDISRIYPANAGFSRRKSHPQQQSLVRRTQGRLPQTCHRAVLSFDRIWRRPCWKSTRSLS